MIGKNAFVSYALAFGALVRLVRLLRYCNP